MKRALRIALSVICVVPEFGVSQPKVRFGSDVFVKNHLSIVLGKRVGLITNHTGRLSSGEHTVDVLLKNGVTVVALFGPEHGMRGNAAAGEKVSDMKDEKTGIPIFSLYGKSKKPTAEMLATIDVLVYDIQDVGVRFYTYISTMGLCMEAAAEKGIPFVVLDRPNPLGGLKVDGPIIEDSLKSFVGMYSIPVVYGLTCGELASMINSEGWLTTTESGLKKRVKCSLTVIKMEGWKRTMTWDETGLQWIPPSPNIRTSQTALVYSATCFIEATDLSEGRGTEKPFQFIGAPFMIEPADSVASMLRAMHELPGVSFTSVAFTPKSSKFAGEQCGGFFIEVTDWNAFQPVQTGLSIMTLSRKWFAKTEIRESWLRHLLGSRAAVAAVMNGEDRGTIASRWRDHAQRFRERSKPYLLY